MQSYQKIMQAICCSCQFIGRPQALKTSRQVQTHQSYYLICEEGHVQCKECVSKNDHDDKFCHLGQNPHPKWANKIECLLHNKDSILLDKLIEHFQHLQGNKKKAQAKLQNCQRQFQDQKRKFLFGDRDKQQQLELNHINISIVENDPMISIGADIDKLQKDISQISQKIRQQKRKYGYFKLVFDSLASAIVLTTTILQGITIVSFFNQDQNAFAFLITYFAILGLYYFSFLVVILWQIYQETGQNFLQKFLYAVLALTLLPIVVALSLPSNTLSIINKNPFDKCYFIPKKNLVNWKMNHFILILKIFVYWGILIRYSTIYQEAYQQAAFILTFFEVISLIYLNLRYNNDKQQLEKILEQHLA